VADDTSVRFVDKVELQCKSTKQQEFRFSLFDFSKEKDFEKALPSYMKYSKRFGNGQKDVEVAKRFEKTIKKTIKWSDYWFQTKF
jgi:hypothetical protein